MGGRSPIFLIAFVLLIGLNVGLGYAVVQQRDQATLARDQVLLENQLAQLTERLEVAKAVDANLSSLKARLATLQSQFRAVEASLYTPDKQSVIEARLTDIATSPRGKGPALSLDRIDTRITDEQPPIKEHTFSVHLRGKMTLVPAVAEQFYADPMLANISRYAVVSPDMRFRDLDIVLKAHYYEADLDNVQVPTEREILAPFSATVSASESAEIDPRLAELRTQVAEARGALGALHPKLLEAAELEARIKLHERLQEQLETLRTQRALSRELATENLPKLYLRVRNSPLGGAALNIDGETVTFPNYGGEE